MDDTSRKYGAEIGQDFPPPYPGGEQVTRVTPSYQGEKQGTTIPYTPGELPYGTNFATYTSETPQTNNSSVAETQRVVRVINRPNPPIENYFACSIFVMLCCCLPFGIVAVVYASQQRVLEATGDFEGARRASSQAKCWSYAGFFTGLATIVGYTVCIFLLYSSY